MKIRTMAAATAAALFAIAGASLAQGTGTGTDAKAKTNGSAASAGQTAKPSKCADLTGDKKAQCLKDEKKPAGAGAGGTKPSK
jgi:hypothetical protein